MALKKVLLALVGLVLVAALALGGLVWYRWEHTGYESVPQPAVALAGQALAPHAYSWHAPVLAGVPVLDDLIYKDFVLGSATTAGQALGDYETLTLAPLAPADCETTLRLQRDGVQLYSGPVQSYPNALLAEAGSYVADFECHYPRQNGQGYGSFYYRAGFTITPPPPEPEPEPVEPTFAPGRTQLEQGDIFAMQLLHLPEGASPTAETELGMANFLPTEDGSFFAAVPIGNDRAPGDYTVTVTAGELQWQATVTVLAYDFPRQNLVIDESTPENSEANSAEAIQEFNNVMLAQRKTADEVQYWEGRFLQPCPGRITTEFGSIRITNGDESRKRYHWGMDIANAEGTPVQASNHGRVVFADYLLAVGWTVIIEHGGGLKSYQYHMLEIYVEEGDMVQQGDVIGAVGTTGYSTGPHLHFEMRIGSQAISPSRLFEDDAGLYSLGLPQEEDESAAA